MSIESIGFLAVWYVAATAAAVIATWRYDRWITKAHEQDAHDATRRVVPTSLLVVAGVGGVELFKVLRLFPIAWIVGDRLIGVNGLIVGLATAGVLLADSMIAYAAAGWPMISGDLLRETRAREQAEGIAQERLHSQSTELSLYAEVKRLAITHGIDETLEALETLR